MSAPRIPVESLVVDPMVAGMERIAARARGQVIHPVDAQSLAGIIGGLRSPNHGRRRRSEKQLLRLARRGVVRPGAR
jgi:hypothetical protein